MPTWHRASGNPDGVTRYEDIFEGSGGGFMEFVFEQHRQADGGHDITVRGRYSDAWSRRSGRWGIDERHYRHHIVQVAPASGL
jgi:hypothetical protein